MKSKELPVLSKKLFDEDNEQYENVPKKGLFRTVFRRGTVEIQPFTELNPRSDIKFNKLKKLLLIAIICALCVTVLLISRHLTFKDSLDTNTVQTDSPMDPEFKSNRLIRNGSIDVEEEKSVEEVVRTQISTNTIITTTSTKTSTQSTLRTTLRTTLMPTKPVTKTKTTLSSTTLTTPTPSITTRTTLATTKKIKYRNLEFIKASIVINRATVPNKDGFFKTDQSDTYVRVLIDNHFIGETPVKKNTLSPEWNYQIAHQMVMKPDAVIQFELYDSDKYGSHDFLGKFLVKITELISDRSNGKLVNRYHGSGQLWFTITWTEHFRYYDNWIPGAQPISIASSD